MNFIRAFALLMLMASVAFAQIPRTIAYQGVLADSAGHPKPDGSYTIAFRLYDVATGGTPIWSESRTLQITRGLFAASLGSQTPFGPAVRFDRQYWLALQIGNEPELSPRLMLGAVGYSFSALVADSARALSGPAGGDLAGAFPSPVIAPGAVTGAKIASESVTDDDIKDIVRSISFPARSLSRAPVDGRAFVIDTLWGLTLEPSNLARVYLFMERPRDWNTKTDLIIHIVGMPATSLQGDISFVVSPQSLPIGGLLGTASPIEGVPVPAQGLNRFFVQEVAIPAEWMLGDFWAIEIQNRAPKSTYNRNITLTGVTVVYTAIQ